MTKLKNKHDPGSNAAAGRRVILSENVTFNTSYRYNLSSSPTAQKAP